MIGSPDLRADLSALDRGGGGKTHRNGEPRPRVGETIQIGIEGVFPINDRTGKHGGVRACLRVDLDPLLPGL